ncbi:hypothetical protein [Polaromonas sp.]|uniref:hypothetical protein n=1 Tax=Polaromonas sp. TaxID=1869339 RepID=UPI003266DF12
MQARLYPPATWLILPAALASCLGAATLPQVTIAAKANRDPEVWVYRQKTSQPMTAHAELVILFTPAGVVKKTRIRPACPAPE